MKKIVIGFIAIGLITFVGCISTKVKDADGNTYKTVKIGSQEWMVENLNLDHFQNGDIIPEAKTKEEWVKAGENKFPAWCYYKNNPSNGEKYGKLYNWFAVNDPRGLAPEGWHVPTDAEWTVLTDYLGANGHSDEIVDVLKATSGWDDDGNGTDDYGWLGLPGGIRRSAGHFLYIGRGGSWWSSSESKKGFSWHRYFSSSGVYFYEHLHQHGYSVRCLRD